MGLKIAAISERGAEEKPDDCLTAPVRKITSACDIWTDQTRNRTSTTVEFASRNDEEQEQNPAEDQFEFGGHGFLVFTFKLGGHAPYSERRKLSNVRFA
jgi:hypothetical protein